MRRRLDSRPMLLAAALFGASAASSRVAQDKGTVNPKPLPPLANPNDPELAAQGIVRPQDICRPRCRRAPIGFYAKGCLAGGEALPINGETWQVMRLSRNRYWALSDAGRAGRAAVDEGAQATPAGRAFWSATCRSRAAGRC